MLSVLRKLGPGLLFAGAAIGVSHHAVSILTGGPGCGKTTTTLVIVRLLEAMKKRVVLVAPTGRAAQRMSEVIGREAKTIHRLLEWKGGQFQVNEENTLNADFVIIDDKDIRSGVEHVSLYDDEMCVWMSQDHPLANSQHLPLALLAEYRMGITMDSVIVKKFFEQLRSSKNIEPRIVLSTNLQRLLFKGMHENELITVMGRKTLSITDGLVAIPLEGGPYQFKLSAAWNKGRYLSKATRLFLEYAKERLQ